MAKFRRSMLRVKQLLSNEDDDQGPATPSKTPSGRLRRGERPEISWPVIPESSVSGFGDSESMISLPSRTGTGLDDHAGGPGRTRGDSQLSLTSSVNTAHDRNNATNSAFVSPQSRSRVFWDDPHHSPRNGAVSPPSGSPSIDLLSLRSGRDVISPTRGLEETLGTATYRQSRRLVYEMEGDPGMRRGMSSELPRSGVRPVPHQPAIEPRSIFGRRHQPQVETESFETASLTSSEREEQSPFDMLRSRCRKEEELKKHICSKSALAIRIRQNRPDFKLPFQHVVHRMKSIPEDLWPLPLRPDEKTADLARRRNTKLSPFEQNIIELFRRSRDILIASWCNMNDLESLSLLDGGFVTLLTVSGTKQNTATLVKYEKLKALMLAKAVNDIYNNLCGADTNSFGALSHMMALLKDMISNNGASYGIELASTKMARDLFSELRDQSERNIRLAQKADVEKIAECCSCIAQAFDAAVVLHIGAHVYIEDYLSQRPMGAMLFTGKGWCDRRLKLRKMACLSEFFWGSEVWVFEEPGPGGRMSDEPLYLSATAETFANVWGPIEMRFTEGRDELPMFFASHGYLKAVHREVSSLEADTAYIDYHFFPGYRNDDSVPPTTLADDAHGINTPPSMTAAHTLQTLQMLIGAEVVDDLPKLYWSGCNCESDGFRDRMRAHSRLDPLLLSKSLADQAQTLRNTNDRTHVGLVGAGHNWKHKQPDYWKQKFLQSWEDAGSRDLRLLENFWGVAVSFCTFNACRVRLIDLLGADVVLRLLDGFKWGDERRGVKSKRKEHYIAAVTSVNFKDMKRLWQQSPSEDRLVYGDAILHCAKALVETGYHHGRNEFTALWVQKGTTQPMGLMLDTETNPWTKILRDSVDSMTMAVLVEDRLSPAPDMWNHCRIHCKEDARSSVLETAICIKDGIGQPLDLQDVFHSSLGESSEWRSQDTDWEKVWSVRHTDLEKSFWLSSRTKLRKRQILSMTCLLLEWSPLDKADFRTQEMRQFEWEYTDVNQAPTVRPIPVHIM